MQKTLMVFVLIYLLFSQRAFAQNEVIVPDLFSLNVPQAAAALNRAGLMLGIETNELWTADSGIAQNQIKSQSVPAGQSVAQGTTVDITILRSPNAVLVYDDNDLTLINKTGLNLDLAGLTFNALDGNLAQFSAARWGASLRNDQCLQLWSIGRNGPKGIDECSTIQNWLITTNPAEHFWTAIGATTRFSITQNGLQRAICPIANPGRCEFYLPGTTGSDTTDYVYFAYTTHALAIINQSPDRWMSLEGFNVYNNFTQQKGLIVPLGDSSLYMLKVPSARISQLAPNQCILFTDSTLEGNIVPQACDVIAILDIAPQLIFWGADFDTKGVTNQFYSCPAAVPDNLTICIMPR